MLTPEKFQEQILPYLYDLLDAEERRAFEETLEISSSARAGLESARAKQKLLAQAVKDTFPEVTFAPPVIPVRNKEALPMVVRHRKPRRPWMRRIIAATIMVMTLGGGAYLGVAGWVARKHEITQAEEMLNKSQIAAGEMQKKLGEEQRLAQRDVHVLQDQIKALVEDWKKEAQVQKNVFDRKGVQVTIQSPRGLQAGANNPIQIAMKGNQPGQALPPLNARVVNEANKQVLFDKFLETKDGQATFNFDLPRDLPVQPGMNLALEVFSKKDGDAPTQVREHLTLAAPEYVTHLYTDRPMYRPEETIYFRSLTLERFSLKPAGEDLRLRFRITGPNDVEVPNSKMEGSALLTGAPQGPPLQGPNGQPLRGIGAGKFRIPSDLPGGQYTLHVEEASGRFPPEKRSFIIHQWQAPRFNKEITFDRSSYGPGDPVEITALGVPVGGMGPNVEVNAVVTVDGQRIWGDHRFLGGDGRVRYPPIMLPQADQMEKGNGIVSITFNDGGSPETIVRPIPIILGKLFVEFYPEGGDLINGLPNRVYFQAHTTTGKPADLQGRIVDQNGAVLAKVQTLTDNQEPGVNQGMGTFELTPQGGKKYELKIDAPTGMHGKDGTQRFFLPAANASGVVLRLPKGVVEDTIGVEVTSAEKDRQLLVGAYCRGKLLDHANLEAMAGQPLAATLRPAVSIGGVYRITVFEKQGEQFLPLAERLIYRPAAEKLDFTIAADKQVYNPGDKVRLSLQAMDEKREFSPAVLLVSVADLSVQKLANDKTARTMPTHFLLTSEVRRPEDLENADFFLGNHPKARQALDLLLGVQGWRRFAEQDPARFQQQQPDAARILQALCPGGMQTNNPEKEVLAKVDGLFNPKGIELEMKLAEKEKIAAGTAEAHLRILQERIAQDVARNQINGAVNNLEAYENFLGRLVLAVLVIGALFLGLLLLWMGMRRLARDRAAAGFFFSGTVILAFLFIGSLIGTVFLMGGGLNLRGDLIPPFAKKARMIAEVKDAEVKAEVAFGEAAPLNVLNDGVANNEFELLQEKERVIPRMKLRVPEIAGQARLLAKPEPIGRGPMLGGLMIDPKVGGGGIAFEPNLGGMDKDLKDQRRLGNDHHRLRVQGKYQQIINEIMNRPINVPTGADPFIVREYAHVHKVNPDNVRNDFTETLYWHPALVLANGKAEVSFDLSDATGRFQVVVFGHTPDGRLGAATYEITSRLPVSIEPKVPIEVTNSDIITIPVTLANDRKEPATVSLDVQSKNLTTIANPLEFVLGNGQFQPPGGNPAINLPLNLDGNKRERVNFAFQPAVKEGLATLRISGDFGPLGKDTVERTFKIVPEGFPVVAAKSGLLEKSASQDVTLPESWVPGTLKCQVQVFLSTLAELQKGLEGLLREPCGCFEQSSSGNYPNVLILNYLKEADLSRPEVEKRARQLLTSGYAKLTSFECLDPGDRAKREGYEWFGQTAPPHEALTAYGLLQFKDMAKVYPVDEDMLRRTQKYLLDQRDGKGGFKRNPRAIDSFGRAPNHITNAYIVWALTESGLEEDLSPELQALHEKAKESADPYFLALASISHLNQNKANIGVELLKNLGKFQKDDGHLEGAQTSITGSGGRDLVIETTALATLGWLKANRPDEFNTNIDKAVKWLGGQRGGYGGFGSTQSTILALKALIAHTRAHKKPIEAGSLALFVGDGSNPIGIKSFSSANQEPITLMLPENVQLKPGSNRLRIQVTGKNEFPYTVSWSYQTVKPANAENYLVHLAAQLSKTEVREGDTVRLTATVANKTAKGQGMTVAIIGLPGGLALPEDFAQLKEMTALRDNGAKPGLISAWELRGRELVLYWRDLAPEAKIDVNLDLVCRLPGSYSGPASRAYLYYNADNKFWADPLAITIHPAGE